MNQDELQNSPETIFIADEDGNEEEFEVIMKFDVDESNAKYMMVVPVEGNDDSDVEEVYAFRYEEDGDQLTLYTIDSDEEWNMVEETFNTLISEMEDDEEQN